MPTIPWQKLDHTPAKDQEVVVMASRFRLNKISQVPAFFVDAMRILKQVRGSEGAVGVSLVAHPLKREFFTLSAWQDQTAINAMVGQEPHRSAMRRHRKAMESSVFTFYNVPASELPAGWEEARRRLEETDRA
jgi:heme-degrading monooxygenase HmoA